MKVLSRVILNNIHFSARDNQPEEDRAKHEADGREHGQDVAEAVQAGHGQ